MAFSSSQEITVPLSPTHGHSGYPLASSPSLAQQKKTVKKLITEVESTTLLQVVLIIQSGSDVKVNGIAIEFKVNDLSPSTIKELYTLLTRSSKPASKGPANAELSSAISQGPTSPTQRKNKSLTDLPPQLLLEVAKFLQPHHKKSLASLAQTCDLVKEAVKGELWSEVYLPSGYPSGNLSKYTYQAARCMHIDYGLRGLPAGRMKMGSFITNKFPKAVVCLYYKSHDHSAVYRLHPRGKSTLESACSPFSYQFRPHGPREFEILSIDQDQDARMTLDTIVNFVAFPLSNLVPWAKVRSLSLTSGRKGSCLWKIEWSVGLATNLPLLIELNVTCKGGETLDQDTLSLQLEELPQSLKSIGGLDRCKFKLIHTEDQVQQWGGERSYPADLEKLEEALKEGFDGIAFELSFSVVGGTDVGAPSVTLDISRDEYGDVAVTRG